MLKKFQSWLDKKSEDAALNHVKKMSAIKNGEDPAVKYLNIPLLGGIIYLFASYSRALKVVQEVKQKDKEKQNVRIITKEKNQVRKNIQRQISDLLLDNSVSIITVPPEHIGDFVEVVKTFDVGVKQLDTNKFMIIAKEGAVL